MTIEQKHQIERALIMGKLALSNVIENDREQGNTKHLALMEKWEQDVANTLTMITKIKT